MQIERWDMTAEEREMEAALQAVTPLGGARREEMLFAAGRASMGRSLWGWRAAACVGLVSSLALGGMALRPQAGAERVAVVAMAGRKAEVPEVRRGEAGVPLVRWDVSAEADRGESPWAYRQLMTTVLTRGIDAMPTAPNGDGNAFRTIRADGTAVMMFKGQTMEGGQL